MKSLSHLWQLVFERSHHIFSNFNYIHQIFMLLNIQGSKSKCTLPVLKGFSLLLLEVNIISKLEQNLPRKVEGSRCQQDLPSNLGQVNIAQDFCVQHHFIPSLLNTYRCDSLGKKFSGQDWDGIPPEIPVLEAIMQSQWGTHTIPSKAEMASHFHMVTENTNVDLALTLCPTWKQGKCYTEIGTV